MKHRYGKLSLAALLGGVYLSLMYVKPYGGETTLSEMVFQLSGSKGKFMLGLSFQELVDFALILFPAFVFEMYAGIMLYRHFCTASIYVFSRCPHRIKWYAMEILSLLWSVFIFNILLLASAVLVSVCRYEVHADGAGIRLLIYHFLIHSLWTYTAALLVNLAAIHFGSSTGYAAVTFMQLIFIMLLNFTDFIVRRCGIGISYEGPMVWNPIAHLIIGWHKGSPAAGDHPPYLHNISLSHSVAVFLAIGAAVTFAGAVIIKKHDLLVSDIETGEA